MAMERIGHSQCEISRLDGQCTPCTHREFLNCPGEDENLGRDYAPIATIVSAHKHGNVILKNQQVNTEPILSMSVVSELSPMNLEVRGLFPFLKMCKWLKVHRFSMLYIGCS